MSHGHGGRRGRAGGADQNGSEREAPPPIFSRSPQLHDRAQNQASKRMDVHGRFVSVIGVG